MIVSRKRHERLMAQAERDRTKIEANLASVRLKNADLHDALEKAQGRIHALEAEAAVGYDAVFDREVDARAFAARIGRAVKQDSDVMRWTVAVDAHVLHQITHLTLRPR